MRCVSQDRILEKELFNRLGIPTPVSRRGLLADLEAAVAPRAAVRAQDAPARL
jgi:hypothetical protein